MNLDSLRKCPLFSSFDESQLRAATAGMRRQSLQAGAMLFHQDDEAQCFYVVERGVIKLTRLSPEGKEKVIELIRSGETFAEAVMFMDSSRYPVSAQAVDDSVVLRLKSRHFSNLLRTDNRLALRMLGQLSMRMHGLVEEVERLTLYDATQRLVNYLISEFERSNTTHLTLAIPKQVIASRLCITPETFSRLIQRLRGAGVLELRGTEITVNDLSSLRAYQHHA